MVDSGIRDKWLRDGKNCRFCMAIGLTGLWFSLLLQHGLSDHRPSGKSGEPPRLHSCGEPNFSLPGLWNRRWRHVTQVSVLVFLRLSLLGIDLAFSSVIFYSDMPSCAMVCQQRMEAIANLAWEGLVEGMQNRFPLTWSERRRKIHSIVGWTVCYPKGSLTIRRILDFWTSDWTLLGR